MLKRMLQSMPVAILAAAALPCAAEDHVVFVNDGNFDPKDLTIHVGDTVTFKEFGDLAAHNVHANDESFRCAVGCRGDGSGATGDPAKGTWQDTIAFGKPGIVGYVCDPHSEIMTGIIRVDAVAAGQNISAGLSGNWNDPTPNKGGHGIQVEVLPNNGILVLWFVFNPAGSAQAWIYTQGAYDPASNTVAIPAFLETGGTFPPNCDASKLTVTPWGSLEFKFTDCTHGTAEYTPNDSALAAGYHQASFPIQQLTKLAGTTCP